MKLPANSSALWLVPRFHREMTGRSTLGPRGEIVGGMSIAQLQALAASVGFPADAVPTAAAIAMAESGGNPHALGDTEITPGGSEGLWQVNLASHQNYDPEQLYDPTYNARAALAISSGGTNWTPWSTYNSGAYKEYLQPYAPPSSSPWSMVLKIGAVAAAGAAAYFFAPLAPKALAAAASVL